MKSTLLIAALFAATAASAQSPLLLPNNSAGTPMDTPPVLPTEPEKAAPAAARSDAPADIDRRRGFDAADKNHDGRVDANEVQRPQAKPAPAK